MLRAVIGKPGHGKSLYLLYCMLQAALAKRPVATNIELTEACPFHHLVIRLDDGTYPVFQLPEISRACPTCIGKGSVRMGNLDRKKCPTCRGNGKTEEMGYVAFWHYMQWGVTYVLDELDNLFDSMDFQRLAAVATDARLYFKQHRKRADVVVYAVQNLDNIWTRIRRMTESFVVCEWNYRSNPLFSMFPKSWSSFNRAEFADANFSGQPLTEGRFWYAEAAEMFTWYHTSQLVGDPALYGWSGANGSLAPQEENDVDASNVAIATL